MPDTVLHIVFDFVIAAVIAITAHHTGAVGAACEFHILFEGFSVVFGHDLLHAARIVIDPIRSVAWAHDKGKAQRNMFTAFPLIWTAEQGIVVFRAVPDVPVEAL